MTESFDITWRFTAGQDEAGKRLDRVWAARLADQAVSRGRVQAWIADGRALVNGSPATSASLRVEAGQELSLAGTPGRAEGDPLPPDSGPLPVLFEDEHMVVVDKPAGISTHPAPGEQGSTVVHRLVDRWPDMAVLDPVRPGVVHRLDKPTSGVMVAARTEAARLALAAAFAERRVVKYYLAVVHGRPAADSGIVTEPIGRDPRSKVRMAVTAKGGRPSRSDWRRLWTDPDGRLSLVAVRIHTGRTHQVRVHLAHLGHPLVGDETYGPREHTAWLERGGPLAPLASRVMLHALRLGLDHPVTGEPLVFRAPVPGDMLALLGEAARVRLRVGVVGLAGSGKSALMDALENLGAPVFRADEAVAGLYRPGGDGAGMIEARFGGRYTASDRSVDKKALLAAMLESDNFRREVMELVHPMVEHQAREFFAAHQEAPAAFAEVALLLEGGWPGREIVDLVTGVWCPEDKRTGTMREQRGLDPDTLAAFDAWQWPGPDKIRASQLVVDNSGGLDDLRARAEALVRVCAGLADHRRERVLAGIMARIDGIGVIGEEDGPA